jgi:protein SCO1/2
MTRTLLTTTLLLAFLAAPSAGTAQGIGGGMVVEDEATLIKQRLGAFIAKDAVFKDSTGKQVRIADYLGKGQPLILNLQFFSCPSLCGPVLNGLITALEAVPPTVGTDLKVLSVSFDHREEPELAAYKKKSILGVYDRAGAAKGWHFLTGDRENILELTESVGYGFRWNTTRKDFDHKAAMIFISPSGKITRYLRGAAYDTGTFRLAIVEASEGTVGTAMDRFILSCYSYDPLTGTYSRIGPIAMATGGALTLLGLGSLLFVLFRRERRERRQQVAPAAAS